MRMKSREEQGKCSLGYCGDGLRRSAATTKIVIDGSLIACCERCWEESAVTQLWEFLTEGKAPGGLILRDWQPVKPQQAMKILYVLQEFLHVLPDRYELCDGCNSLFDSEENNYRFVDGVRLCECCAPYEADVESDD
jgi:hypothetical protein